MNETRCLLAALGQCPQTDRVLRRRCRSQERLTDTDEVLKVRVQAERKRSLTAGQIASRLCLESDGLGIRVLAADECLLRCARMTPKRLGLVSEWPRTVHKPETDVVNAPPLPAAAASAPRSTCTPTDRGRAWRRRRAAIVRGGARLRGRCQ